MKTMAGKNGYTFLEIDLLIRNAQLQEELAETKMELTRFRQRYLDVVENSDASRYINVIYRNED